jgi:hypothetical protein
MAALLKRTCRQEVESMTADLEGMGDAMDRKRTAFVLGAVGAVVGVLAAGVMGET